MYEKIKNIIFTTLYVLLLLRFALFLGDPLAVGLDHDADMSGALVIYTGGRWLIETIYILSGIITWPLSLILSPINSEVFPSMWASALGMGIQENVVQNPGIWPEFMVNTLEGMDMKQTFPGVVDWISLIMLVVLRVVSPSVDTAYEFARNMIWNVLIEFSFSKKKQALYQEALERRAGDLMKMTADYRTVTKEREKLKDTVITDELTNVYNKRFFLDKILEAFTASKETETPMGVLMIDIDHFKLFNDTYGHLMGDMVLKEVAQVGNMSTPPECFFCRFGGEEFGVIMPDIPFSKALEVAKSIESYTRLLRFDEIPEVRVTISQGLFYANFRSPLAQNLKEPDEMIKNADDLLYKAKDAGRDQVQHTRID